MTLPVTAKLLALASDRWAEIDASYYQIDLLRLPCHRLLNMVYVWCIQRIDPEKLDEWLAELAELLPWQDPDGEAGEALESASFMEMMAKGD